MAGDREQRRGIVDHLQAARIVRFPHRHERDTEFLCRRDFALGVGARKYADAVCAAAAREPRQGIKCRARAAVMIDQRAERARPDIFTANEAQPVEPLLVAQSNALRFVVHHAPGWQIAHAHTLQSPV